MSERTLAVNTPAALAAMMRQAQSDPIFREQLTKRGIPFGALASALTQDDKPLCTVPGCLVDKHRTHYANVGAVLVAGVDLCVLHWLRATETPMPAEGQS